MSKLNDASVHFTTEQLEAFQKARRIHTITEMIEIQGHSAYEWTGVFAPLNELNVQELIELLKLKEGASGETR